VTIQQVLLGGLWTPNYSATWNPSDKTANVTLSNGNLTAAIAPTAGNQAGVRATVSKSINRWYWEITVSASSQTLSQFGIATSSHTLTAQFSHSSSTADYATTDDSAATYSILLDLDAHLMSGWRNGVAGLTDVDISAITDPVFPAIHCERSSDPASITLTVNFGATAFSYGPPAGYAPFYTT
jgi:hypothetical protein